MASGPKFKSFTTSSRNYFTGDEQIDRTLKNLQSTKVADRIAKSCLGAAMVPLKRGMKAAAPVGATGETRASIGSRLERSRRTGAVTAKVGVDVGKSKPGKKYSDHAWIVALRTHFVQRGYEAARSKAAQAMRDRAAKRLAKEAAKARAS